MDEAVVRTTPRTARPSKAKRYARWAPAVVIYGIGAALAVAFLAPLIWLILTSVKSNAELASVTPLWIPSHVDWSYYPQVFQQIPYWLYFRNTAFVTVMTIIGTVLSCSLVAYGLSLLRWRGRDVAFVIILATLMVPYQVTMIPLFVVFKTLGWVNTFLPLIVPPFFGNAFYIFLLRQFMMTIPHELMDAAKIDGAGEFRVFWQIALPLSKAALTSVVIFAFLSTWNDFLGPLIYLGRSDLYTLSLGMQQFQGAYGYEYQTLMAGSVLMVLPIVAVFFVAQRHFVEGITLGGVKG